MQLPKGQSLEVSGDGREPNQPGVYYLPGADKFVETHPSFNDGSIQADALVRTGYRLATDEEIARYKGKSQPSQPVETASTTEAATTEYQVKQDKSGKTYYVGPNNRRVSKEEYEANS